MSRETWRLRGRVLPRLSRQAVRESYLSWGPYITATLGLLLALLLLYNTVRFVGQSGLAIVGRPFFTPLLAACGLALLYVTLDAALAIARPREQGTLQLLFLAPVDALSLVGAHYLAGTAVYALLLLLLLPPLLLMGWLVNIAPPTALLWGLVPTLVAAGVGVAFGLFLSAAAPSARSALLLLVGATLLLLAIQGGYRALLNVPPTSRYYDALLFMRLLLRTLNGLLLWGSPFGLLDSALAAALRQDLPGLVQSVLRGVGGTLLWLTLAVIGVRRRGVLP